MRQQKCVPSSLLGDNTIKDKPSDGFDWCYPVLVWLVQIAMAAIVIAMFSKIIHPMHNHSAYFWSWDGGAYFSIARDGYLVDRSAGFFPFYPILIYIVHFIPGLSFKWSAVVVNYLSLLAALMILFRFVQETQGRAIAKRSLWLIMAFPTAMFFLVAYTESLTLLTFILFFYLLHHKHWYWAMCVGFLSSITHDLNCLLVFAGLAHLWCQRQNLDNKTLVIRFFSLGIIPLSIVFWMGYLYLKLGNPFAVIHAADTYWFKRYVFPIAHQAKFLWQMIFHHSWGDKWYFELVMLVNGVCIALMLLMGGLLLTCYRKKISFEQKVFFVIYFLVTLIPASGGGTLESEGRYMVVLFPGFIAWALLAKREWVFLTSVMMLLPIKTILLGMLVNCYWIT